MNRDAGAPRHYCSMNQASSAAAVSTSDDVRRDALARWLSGLPPQYGIDCSTLRAASADASFRRYFRVDAAGRSLIAMDAPT